MNAVIATLLKIVDCLAEQNIEYAVMGGLAVRAHAIPRPTNDVDLTVALSRESLPSWYDKLENIGVTVPEGYRTSILARKIQTDVEGRQVWLVAAEDLILLKLIASRPRDLVDISDIFLVQGELDQVYMRKWSRPLGIETQLAKS
jgi:hypothetical protein